jgi:hypothetical protein
VADIDVVKGGGSRTWIWWIVAAVAVVVLLLMLTRDRDEGRRVPAGSSVQEPVATSAA